MTQPHDWLILRQESEATNQMLELRVYTKLSFIASNCACYTPDHLLSSLWGNSKQCSKHLYNFTLIKARMMTMTKRINSFIS